MTMVSYPEVDRFVDRADAADRLAEVLLEREVHADLVLAIPRGGLPIGRAVADTLDVPLDVVITSKLGAPNNPELAIGAVASDGTVWLDDGVITALGVSDSYIERERNATLAEVASTAERYRHEAEEGYVEGKDILLVDDGVATGSTTLAAIKLLREQGVQRITVAVPVGSTRAIELLEREADVVVCLLMPPAFGAVGQYYERFDQVSHEEALQCLGVSGE